MNLFKLPDLGEGIPEAEIHEWHVSVGDNIKQDTVLVSMETAKAVVEVPAPFSGTIEKLFGQPGDIISTGDPLVGYLSDTEAINKTEDSSSALTSDKSTSNKPEQNTNVSKILPAVRLLASQLGVDLNTVQGTGNNGMITSEDVKRSTHSANLTSGQKAIPPEGFEPIKGVRRAMAQAMKLSQTEVCPVTLGDDANLSAWQKGTDITLRVIQAIMVACQKEPALNAWFDGKTLSRRCHNTIHLGIAMDSDDGLFVPVLRDLQTLTPETIRNQINHFKEAVKSRTIAPELLRDPTITLSNFGVFAGRYATPVVVPPTVAIIGTGRIYQALQLADNGDVEKQSLLPLSLTVDHRACTGGEAARFLKVMLEDLAQSR